MSPLPALGIFANAPSGGSFESISTVTVGAGGASAITFSSLPSTYKHLQIRSISRSTSTAGGTTSSYGASGYMRFNSDSSGNYMRHYLLGDGSSVAAGASVTNSAQIDIDDLGGTWGGVTAGIMAVGVVDILDYQNTNKYKTIRTMTGQDRNGYGRVVFGSGLWRSASAINSISITTTGDFAQYTTFALYGIKG